MSGQKINIPMLGLFLGIVSAVAAGLLSGVNAMTQPQIAANKKASMNEAMMKVLPLHDNDPLAEVHTFGSADGWPVTFYTARLQGAVVGYAGTVDNTDEGFSGTVSLMVGLAPDGSVAQLVSDGKTNSAVIVTAQTETPGLGTSVTDRKVQKTVADLIRGTEQGGGLVPNPYLDWYAGRRADKERWTIVKDGAAVNGKTGATITSRAVCGAVHAVSLTAVEHLDQLNESAGE